MEHLVDTLERSPAPASDTGAPGDAEGLLLGHVVAVNGPLVLGCLREGADQVVGAARIGTLVKDVVTETLAGGLTEIRMSDRVLDAVLRLRAFLFDAVYENTIATAEFKKASGILSGLWEKVQERPDEFLDARTVAAEGIDAATRDFIAGMTDRYAVRLFEQLFIPKPWTIE